MRQKSASADDNCRSEDNSLLLEMHSSIRESKNSLFSYGNEGAANHRVSLYVAGVCACILVFITIVLVSIPGNLYSTNAPPCNCTNPPQQAARCKHAKRPHANPALERNPRCDIQILSSECHVKCFRIGVEVSGENPGQVAVTEIANFYRIHSNNCSFWTLWIGYSEFTNNTIHRDWFVVDDVSAFPPIKSLELQACFNLKIIEEGALEKYPFGLHLKSFTLARNMAFNEIKSGLTKGLHALMEFSLRENGIITVVDHDIFDPFKSSLQILQVHGGFASADQVATMTGICQQNILSELTLVDLSFNSNGDGFSRLGADQLSALKKVQSLYLQQSGIGRIEVDAFEPVSDTIKLLNLIDNDLGILLDGTFEMFIPPIELFLAGNKWSCDCILEWLQVWLANNSLITVSDNPICNSPESERGKSLQTANMSSMTTTSCRGNQLPPRLIKCPNAQTTSIEPPTTSTSTSTSAPDIQCQKFVPEMRYKSSGTDRSPKFNVAEDSMEEHELAQVVVETGEEGEGKTLVWHHEEQRSCLRGVWGAVRIKNLTRGVAYVFCLYEGDDIESASQCQGVKTLPAWAARAWIVNEKMPMWVALFVIIAIVCALVGAASVVFAFWRKPTLLALSSRVVKVRTSRHEAVIMPKRRKGEKLDMAAGGGGGQEVDSASIGSDPSYVSVKRPSKVSLFAFRFRAWLRKVENGEISVENAMGEANLGRERAVSASVATVSSGCSHF